jgi:hypothetical protein
MATVRLSLVLTLVGVYLLFWLGLRHDDLPSHNTARRQRHDPNSNYGGSHGAGRHHRHHKDNLNPPASPVLAAVADAAAAAPRVRRWADQDYPPPPPRVVEQAHEAEMGVENVQDDVVGVDDVGALDASGMEEGSVEPEVVAEEEELQGAEEEEGVPEADELAQPQPIDVVQQVTLSRHTYGQKLGQARLNGGRKSTSTAFPSGCLSVIDARPQLALAVATRPYPHPTSRWALTPRGVLLTWRRRRRSRRRRMGCALW